jgi:hypothetical protein
MVIKAWLGQAQPIYPPLSSLWLGLAKLHEAWLGRAQPSSSSNLTKLFLAHLGLLFMNSNMHNNIHEYYFLLVFLHRFF